jgi:hypothetical protein
MLLLISSQGLSSCRAIQWTPTTLGRSGQARMAKSFLRVGGFDGVDVLFSFQLLALVGCPSSAFGGTEEPLI